MGYDIRAWLDRDGTPRLQLLDSDSGNLCLSWAPDEARSGSLKSLFHDLMLLTARDNLRDRLQLSQTPRSTRSSTQTDHLSGKRRV